MKINTAGKASPWPRLFLALLVGCTIDAGFLSSAKGSPAGTIQPTPTPCGTVLFSQNFDSGVTPPALPLNWRSTFTNGFANCASQGTCTLGSDWVTTANAPDTVPLAAFHNDPSCVTNAALDMPPMTMTSPTAQLTFRSNYLLENNFDGGVLEVGTPAGGFMDILAAGGSFVTGGYNTTISTAFLSPIAGRLAWTGNSGGYITTIVNLPPQLVGVTVTLRFRLATDCSVSASGWFIDTVSITDGVCPTPTPGPTPVITSPLVATGMIGQPFVYQVEATGADFLDATQLPPGLGFRPELSAIVGTPQEVGGYSAVITAGNQFGVTNAVLGIAVQQVPPAGPAIRSSSSATGRVGQPFNFRVITLGGSPAARLSASGLPAGLSADPVSGIISGVANQAGSFAVTLSVADGNFNFTSILQLTFTADPVRPVIVSPDNAFLTPGQEFSYTIRAPSSADPSDPTVFTEIGPLPPGLGFDPVAGVISGIYNPPPPGGVDRDTPDLAGGALLGSIQLFGTNSAGTSTFQLLFLTAPTAIINISTRMLVGTGEDVLIGGIIVTGNAPKAVILRAIGPSLPVPGALQDPVIELHDLAHPQIVVTNDNWKDTQEQIIRDTMLAPTDDRESAVVIGLDPGNYTAIVRGNANTTGVAVVEAYDLGTASLDASSNARLAQISTRGSVSTGDNVMIGGFIVHGTSTRVIVRAIGPSLNGIVNGALQDPVLELRDGFGSLMASNDNWRSTQEQEIIDTGVPPTNDLESAIVATLVPGPYTGIVRGQGGTTGVALVEVYALDP